MEEATASTTSTNPVPDSGEKPATSIPSTPSQPQEVKKRSERKFVWIIVLSLLFVGCLVVAAWYFQNQLQNTAMENKPTTASTDASTSPKELIIGTDPTLPPMEFMQNGNFVGYDIDLANLLAKEMGVKV